MRKAPLLHEYRRQNLSRVKRVRLQSFETSHDAIGGRLGRTFDLGKNQIAHFASARSRDHRHGRCILPVARTFHDPLILSPHTPLAGG